MASVKRANTSGITKSGTAIADVPDAPTIGTATDAGTGTSVTVTYTAAATGGAVTTFTATSTPGSFTGTGSSPIIVSGLTAGTAYTFKVKGTNATGVVGPESIASNSVTPITPLIGSYDSLSGVTLSSTTTSVTFANIPSGYRHLQIRYIARDSSATSDANSVLLNLNDDSTANYTRHYFYGDGNACDSGYVSQSNIDGGLVVGGGLAANCFGIGIIDILDYNNTSKFKTVRSFSGVDTNYGVGNRNYIMINTGLWGNVSAISSVKISTNGTSFVANSQFGLYGVK